MCLIFILEIIQRKSDKVGSMSQTCLVGVTFKCQPGELSLFCPTISVGFLSPFRKHLCPHLKFAKVRLFLQTSQFKAIFFNSHNSPQWARASSFTRFLDHTQRRTTIGSTLLDEYLPRRRDLYLTKHKTHNRQTSMHPLGFESTISVVERPSGIPGG
jgi:hypothetical protein